MVRNNFGTITLPHVHRAENPYLVSYIDAIHIIIEYNNSHTFPVVVGLNGIYNGIMNSKIIMDDNNS